MFLRLALSLFVLLLAMPGLAQEPPKPTDKVPVLTDVQRLTVENALLRMEAAQLRFVSLQNDATALLKSLQVAGYRLDIQTLAYMKTPPVEPVGDMKK